MRYSTLIMQHIIDEEIASQQKLEIFGVVEKENNQSMMGGSRRTRHSKIVEKLVACLILERDRWVFDLDLGGMQDIERKEQLQSLEESLSKILVENLINLVEKCQNFEEQNSEM